MKKIYFVRHGESEVNAGTSVQSIHTRLSKNGRNQIELLSNRLSKIDIDRIVSSPLLRAKETAEIILSKICKPIQYSELFVERKRTSEEMGIPTNDPLAIEINRQIRKNFHIKDYRYSDEENFDDFKNRARLVLEYLDEIPDENILVVTHGFFMRIVIAYIVFGESLTAMECEGFIQTFRMENAAISVITNSQTDDSRWLIRTWNDVSHLK